MAMAARNRKARGDAAPFSTADPLDDIIEQIGFGPFQVTMYVAIGLAIIGDGAEMLNVSLISQALGREWSLTATEKGAMGSMIFLGFTAGSLLAGYAGDRFGRRFPLLVFVSLLFISGFSSAFAVNYASLVCLRFFVGTAIGGAVVLVNTLFAEFLPSEHRGRWLILNSLFFPVGEIIAALVAWLVMPNFETGHWRALFALCSIPAFVCFVFGVAWLPESPRYLLQNGDIEELELVLRRMAVANSAPLPDLSPLKKYRASAVDRSTPRAKTGVGALLSPRLRVLTLTLVPLWFCVATVFYGLVYYLPIIFQEQDANNEGGTSAHLDIVISALVEVPGTLFVAFTVDVPAIGRTGLISGGVTGTALALTAVLFLPFGDAFDASCFVAKLCIVAAFAVMFPYTSEAYPTSVRSTGLGVCTAATRIGGIITPPLVEGIRVASKRGPFYVMFSTALIATVCACCLPFDTTGMSLSEIEQGLNKKAPELGEPHPFAVEQRGESDSEPEETATGREPLLQESSV